MGIELSITRRQRGITLVETLVALLILAVVAVSVLTMFSYSMELNTTGLDYATLTNRARDKAEELLATAWFTDSVSGNTIMDPQLSAGAVHQEVQPGNRLNLTWRVQNFEMNQSNTNPPGTAVADPTFANVKVIIVTAVSTSASGVGRRDASVSALKIKG